MALDLDQVRRIAHLARIEITDDEAQRTLDQLVDIFAMIEKMRAVDTTGIEPMAHPLGGHQRLRPDVVTESDQREANLANAPEQGASNRCPLRLKRAAGAVAVLRRHAQLGQPPRVSSSCARA